MKIAFLTPQVPPALEGIGEYAVHLVRALRSKGIDAQIFTSAGQKSEEPWIHPVITQWNGEQAFEAVREFTPDWISFQYSPPLYGRYGFCWKASGIPMELKKRLNVKISVTFHEFQTAWSLEPKKFLAAAVLRLQTCRLLKACDTVIATCESYGAILREKTNRKVFVIPVGGNIVPAASNLQSLKKHYGLEKEKVLSVFGRLSAFRDHKTAVRVLAELRRRGIEAKLLLIGGMRSSSASLFQELTDLSRQLNVEKHLIETGDLSTRDVSAHLQLSDLFLFSQTDGVSTRNTTFLSAMAHGLPIIAYDPVVGNFDGYAIPYGQTIEKGNEKAFIEAACAVLKNAEVPSEAAKIYFQKNFSWDQIADRHLKAFRNTGENRP